MSTAAIARPRKPIKELPWQLWASQLAAILRIEIKKTLWMRRSIWIYLLAFAPTVMFGIHALTSPMGRNCSIEEDTRVLAYTFQIFYLRIGIFFGCMGLFTWLFRGEIVEKSLHYYFLAPMRRELLVAGKFLAGLVTTSLVFASSVLVCFFFVYSHFGSGRPSVCLQRSWSWSTRILSAGHGARLPGLWLDLPGPEPDFQEPDPARHCGAVVGIIPCRCAVTAAKIQRHVLPEAAFSGHHSTGRHHGAVHRDRRARFTMAGDSGFAGSQRRHPGVCRLPHPPDRDQLSGRLREARGLAEKPARPIFYYSTFI